VTDAVWITPSYPWEQQPVSNIFHQTQARALARLGVAVTVISATPWAPWPVSTLRRRWRHYAQAPRIEMDAGVLVARPRYLNIPGQPSWSLPDRLIAQAAYRAHGTWRGASVIHGHSAIEGLAAWRLARRTGLPFVLTFHGSDINTWPDHHPERLSDLKIALRAADRVIAVSSAIAKQVHNLTGVEAVHLPLGSDHRSIAAAALPRQDARKLLHIGDDRIVVLFVGHLLAGKGVRILADGIRDAGGPFLGVFVGGGPEAGYGTTIDGGDTLLEYTGERPHDQVVRYMSAADVLVLPSYSEGLPTVIVEAGSIGLPVIASAVGGIPELLGDDRGALLPDLTADAITAALLAFRADRPAAEARAERLREHVLRFYDVDQNAVRLADIYRSVTSPDSTTRFGADG
jgi:teichuronic acid biosynthesis glycosyltransferase TuaC